MLIERAQRLKATISAIQERAANLGRVQALRTAAEKLTERQRELAALDEWRRTLLERGAAVAPPGTPTSAAYTAVQAYRAKLETSRASAADPAAITQVVTQLRNAASEQRTGLTRTWEEHVRTHAPALNTVVLRVLRDIPSLKQNALRLERCLQRVDGWRQGLPEDAKAVAEFDRAVEEARNTWHQLGGDDLGPDVAQFLQAAATGEAPLDRLTPEIGDWLKKHGIWGAFRITLARDTATPTYR